MKITIHDAEHWITVHPNGNKEEKGTPLLIEGSNGHYVVKGGAGGKLNGKTVTPKSMSKARGGSEGGSEGSSGTEAPKGETKYASPTVTSSHNEAHAGLTEALNAAGIKHKRSKYPNQTSIAVPEYTARWTPEQQKTIQEAAIAHGYTYVQGVPIDPNEYLEGRMQYSFYHGNVKPEAPKPVEAPNNGKPESWQGQTLGYESCRQLLTNKRVDGKPLESEAIGEMLNLLKNRGGEFEPRRDENGNPHWSRVQLGAAYRTVMQRRANEASRPKSPMEQQYEEKRAANQALTRKANELSEKATTIEEHTAAMAAHYAAYRAWEPWKLSRKNDLNHHGRKYHEHKKEVARLEREAKKGQPRKKKEAPKGTSFVGKSPEQIHTFMKDKWNLNFTNGFSKAKADELKMAYLTARDPEVRNAKWREHEHYTNHPASRVRGLTPIDITENKPSAKAAREMCTHVDNALNQLQESGFDIKTALTKAEVHFVAASTGKANGLAWGGTFMGGGNQGYFAVSPAKRGSFNAEQARRNAERVAAGQARWSVSSSSEDQTRATIVHELAHALGIRSGVESPNRLADILHRIEPDYTKRKAWIKANISEYATSNIKETDAEIAAMVTDPKYKWGTLPKELEDHVKWLFNHKG